jgi:basic amino acid/polyamine antiporter, APA family
MLFGLALYVAFRRYHGLPLTQTVKVQALSPLGVEEVEYRSVLVAFEDDPFRDDTVGTAARLAADRRRGIHVISLINVPKHLPLDASLDEAETAAQEKIERAKLLEGLRVTGHTMRVRPGQAGHAIIDEAREIDAAAVVMQLDYRNGMPLYGSTLRMVLAERPCRVIVAAEPTTVRQEAQEEIPAG